MKNGMIPQARDIGEDQGRRLKEKVGLGNPT